MPRIAVWFVLAVAAGLLSGSALHLTRGRFDKMPQTYANPTEKQSQEFNRQRQRALLFSTGMTTGIAGAIISGYFGLAIGALRASPLRAVPGLVVGVVAGAVLVGLGGAVGGHGYAVVASSSREPLPVWGSLFQLTFWLPQAVAVAAAAGVTIRKGELLRTTLACLAGSVIASVLFPVLGLALLVITSQNSRDCIPPDTLAHCLLMGITGTTTTAALIWMSFRRRFSAGLATERPEV